MKKKNFSILCYLLLLATLAQAQVPDVKKLYRETAFLHTDRNCYLAGEIVWMKMYAINDDATDGYNSAIGYIELYNLKNSNAVLQVKILLDSLSQNAGYLQLPDSLSTGIYRLRAYTRNMEQYGFAFEKNIHIINSFRPIPHLHKATQGLPEDSSYHLHTTSINDRYGKRQPVKISFTSLQQDQRPAPAHLSASVFRLDELQTIDSPGIRTLALPTASRLLSKDETHLPEAYSQVLTGSIVDKKTGQPLDVPIMLTVTGHNPRFYCNPSVKGKFSFELRGYNGDANVILQTSAKDCQITVNSPFDNYTPPHFKNDFYDEDSAAAPANTESLLTAQLLSHHIALQVQQAFYGDSLQYAADRFTDTTFFFTKPDETVWLDDYTRFNTLEEVFREFVKTVMVRKSNDTLHLHTLNNLMANPKFFEEDPLILLDGVPVFDNKRLFAIDPLKIRKVSVMARKAFYPGKVFNGIVSLQTYTADMAGYQLAPSTLVADYNGTQLPLLFYAPDYAKKNIPSIPDQRFTLYWNPDVRTDEKGNGQISFYTGDEAGRYGVVLEGVFTHGTPCYMYKTFIVE
ncbi:hypothetical protein GA0116948_101294 [Chitinophaga costaii]|uniref:MG2 domain-containing protein n=1 Tax=Chitinophaga costaii TaxID=1335309 RepID=A0A1C3Z991_9BACT|nr:hypothetical protein [Chitinophaga costaii]PUZ30283.1 hypothetical protein DCM91_02065 [Chitinophaga costaii]SCB78941.1 hypothetical protein GA0116948_101294 [Chitinophaga costaii]